MKERTHVCILILVAFVSCEQASQQNDVNLKRSRALDSTLQWTDYRIGEPPPYGYYKGFDSVVKRWGIRYQRIDGGCEEIPEERRKYEKDNPEYFRILEKRFGKNWRDRFFAEVRLLNSTLQTNPPN